MPEVVEPGTRLVQRYRLEEFLGGPGDGDTSITTTGGDIVEGAVFWRAHDELLDRPVGVYLLQAGSSYAERVLAAARRAAVLTDARFLRILDAAEVDGLVYVVSEWVPARSLADLVADEPLPPAEARALALEIAHALAAAHDAGIDHLSLRPEHVLQTSHGQVKLAGLAVDAAARGVRVDDPLAASRRDAVGAASVLYAALTGRWPGEGTTSLPPAPADGDSVCSPRQVRAGVPDDLDDVVARALGLPGRHQGPALESVEDLASALTSAQLTSRLHVPSGRSASAAEATVAHPPVYADDPAPAAPAYDDPPYRERRRASARSGGRPRAASVLWAVVALVLVLGIGLAGGQLLMSMGGPDADAGPRQGGEQGGEQPARELARLEVAQAGTLDPRPDGNGEENDDRAGRAVDGDPDSVWTTKTYNDQFGPTGLKDGVGLLLELAEPGELAEVAVTVRGSTDLEVRVAGERSQDLADYEVVDELRNVDGRAVVRLPEAVQARYVLVWITELPPVQGRFKAQVAEVVLRG